MSSGWYYKPGDNWVLDDFSGFKIRASTARMQWDNRFTAPGHWSPRHPQDLVTGVRDTQTVAIARPRQQNQFTIVATFATAAALAGANTITVDSSIGFNIGDLCQVILDSGVPFQFTVSSIGGSTISWVGSGLPFSVGVLYGDPIENAVVDLTSVGGN